MPCSQESALESNAHKSSFRVGVASTSRSVGGSSILASLLDDEVPSYIRGGGDEEEDMSMDDIRGVDCASTNSREGDGGFGSGSEQQVELGIRGLEMLPNVSDHVHSSHNNCQ